MSLPTFEPIGHAVPHALQEAAGMMRNTETKELELRPHRYLRECDVLKEMRMIKDKLDEYEERQDAQRQAVVDAGLVERMVYEYMGFEDSRDGMTAALRVAIAAHNSKEAAALRAQSEAMTAEGKLIEELKARIAVLENALNKIAAWEDTVANDRLAVCGRYSWFDEPWSVELARAALATTEPRP